MAFTEITPNQSSSFSSAFGSSAGLTELHRAAANGDLDAAVRCIKVKCNPADIPDDYGQRPSFYAAREGETEVSKYLSVREHVRVNKEGSGSTALHAAAYLGFMDVVKLIIKEGNTPPDASDKNIQTPLFYAAHEGRLEIVKYLLATGNVQVDRKNHNGFTALHSAADGGHLKLVKYFIEEKNVPADILNDFDQTPFYIAAREGRQDVVEYLSSRNDVSVTKGDLLGLTGLHAAAKAGQLDVVKYLIEVKNVDVNQHDLFGLTPVRIAAKFCVTNVMTYFLNEKLSRLRLLDKTIKSLKNFATDAHKLDFSEFINQYQKDHPQPDIEILRQRLHSLFSGP